MGTLSEMLKVLATHAVQGALLRLTPRFEAAHGTRLAVDYDPTSRLMARIEAGERADVALLTRDGADALAARGILDGGSAVALGRSWVGLAVKAGAPRPDISTAEALTATLLAARSLAYSSHGASGVLFAGLIERLGIADAVNAKATLIPSGFTAALVARGEAEMAVQQLSELMAVPGVDIVGPLPASLQTPTLFVAAAFSGSANAGPARALLAALASPEAAADLKATGLEPVR
jgi:molybdate transport system substrate-binding protein